LPPVSDDERAFLLAHVGEVEPKDSDWARIAAALQFMHGRDSVAVRISATTRRTPPVPARRW
jgi:hypothetical protein